MSVALRVSSAAVRSPSSILAAILFSAPAACSKAPAELDVRPSSTAQAPSVAPLLWDAPGSWTKLGGSGPTRATYRIGKVGDDKEEAEMTVLFFGTGSKGDPAPVFKEWIEPFDGNPAASAKRESFEVKGFKVETVEVAGTYKIALTPPSRRMKKAPVQMVKNGYRLHGAVVKTADRGNWFFKLVGPDETVQSSKSAFRAMLETLR